MTQINYSHIIYQYIYGDVQNILQTIKYDLLYFVIILLAVHFNVGHFTLN